MLDTAEVARLIWACLAGQAGIWPRIVAFGILLSLACMTVIARYHPNQPSPPMTRKKAARPSRPSKGEVGAGQHRRRRAGQ